MTYAQVVMVCYLTVSYIVALVVARRAYKEMPSADDSDAAMGAVMILLLGPVWAPLLVAYFVVVRPIFLVLFWGVKRDED
jgi:hypothetical protein